MVVWVEILKIRWAGTHLPCPACIHPFVPLLIFLIHSCSFTRIDVIVSKGTWKLWKKYECYEILQVQCSFSIIRTLHLPDEFCLEQNYETLFCTNNLEFCIPDSEGLFLPQTLIMRYKIPHLSGLWLSDWLTDFQDNGLLGLIVMKT